MRVFRTGNERLRDAGKELADIKLSYQSEDACGLFHKQCGYFPRAKLTTYTTMSQKTRSPESAENSKLAGHGSDTLYLSSPSGEDLKVAVQDPGSGTNNIKLLLGEFKRLYEHRLRCLELDTNIIHEEKKVNFLWSYVNDLADQNQVLVQTIEDLQKEADYKVSNWGMKLCTSDRILEGLDW
ncbi:hypothetical protein FQN60_013839 [Etheostoma spectabile]|uniref:Uncharacterized protein n=1 Tax=Etheostoma spectabile TaxID=54343 RepID=A0A5J5CLA0_9PERO|nr:hypothetical protein FQN60_013839 [Etheostoma spectabile]